MGLDVGDPLPISIFCDGLNGRCDEAECGVVACKVLCSCWNFWNSTAKSMGLRTLEYEVFVSGSTDSGDGVALNASGDVFWVINWTAGR